MFWGSPACDLTPHPMRNPQHTQMQSWTMHMQHGHTQSYRKALNNKAVRRFRNYSTRGEGCICLVPMMSTKVVNILCFSSSKLNTGLILST